jgi:hypothetical protein
VEVFVTTSAGGQRLTTNRDRRGRQYAHELGRLKSVNEPNDNLATYTLNK